MNADWETIMMFEWKIEEKMGKILYIYIYF